MIRYIKDKSKPIKTRTFGNLEIEVEDTSERRNEKDRIVTNGIDVLAYFIANGSKVNGSVEFMNKLDQFYLNKEDQEKAWNKIPEPSAEHIAHASKIRDYFNGRGTMQRLQNNNFTDFKMDMYYFTSNCVTEVLGKYFGILNKIQEFYNYDQELEDIKDQCPMARIQRDEGAYRIDELELDLVKSIERRTSRVHHLEYWFKNEPSQAIYRMSIKHDNNLVSLLDHFIEQYNNKITIHLVNGVAIQLNGVQHFNFIDLRFWDFNKPKKA